MTAVVLRGDARRLPLPDGSVDLICCSPPYFGLRSYTDNGRHYDGQIGSEASPGEWVAALVACTAEWVRVLKPSGSLFVNLGDKYAGSGGWANGEAAAASSTLHTNQQRRSPGRKPRPPITDAPPKSLLGLPWRYALACMDELGLILRRDIIWSKPNGLPESVTDRCRSSHEYLFHFTRLPRYYAAVDEIRTPAIRTDVRKPAAAYVAGVAPGSNGHTGLGDRANHALGSLPGSVWEIPSQPLSVPAHLGVDHFAAFPMELPRRCILGWSPPGVCTACGEGRRPVTDKRLVGIWHDKPAQNSHYSGNDDLHMNGRKRATDPMMRTFGSTEATITGYACGCPDATAPVRPAVVVDPFGGTGTTALVASMHGRLGVSVDLSADYCRLARWRTTDPAERARALQVPKPPPVPSGQGSLFDDLEAS